MKRILALSLVVFSLFPMELAYKVHNPLNRFNRITSAIVKNHKKKIPSVVSTPVADIPVMHIKASSVRAPHSLSDAQLCHDKEGFFVLQNNKKSVIESCCMDKTARSITREGLKPFLKTGFFKLNQATDGSFKLEAHHRLCGGGPIFGKIMYWATKMICYTVLIAGTGAIVVSGGSVGVAAVKGAKGVHVAATTAKVAATAAKSVEVATTMIHGASGVVLASAGSAATITQASGAAIFAPAVVNGAMTTSGILASGVVAAGYAPECATVTGAVLASGASTGGIVAGIELLSLNVGIFFGLTPTP